MFELGTMTMHDHGRLGVLALTLSTLAVAGCRADDAPTEIGDGDELAITYWQDVAPIYFENCVSCHREGGIGPFVLDDYASAAAWAPASAVAVDNRVMPPWLVTDDGSCNTWQGSRALSQAEIDTIVEWADGGAIEGQPRDDLTVPELPKLEGGTPFVTPLFTPEPAGGALAKFDEYRCFLIDPALDQDMFITGYEVVPGNEALVHHALTSVIDPNLEVGEGVTNLDVITALDQESPDRLGWPCFGIAGEGVEPSSLPATWAPGQGIVNFPEGSGSRISAGNLLVIQIHYNMVDPTVIGQSDSTTVNLRLESEVEREGVFDLVTGLINTLLEGDPHTLAPGNEAETFTYTFPAQTYIDWLGTDTVELWGFFPHMHERGTTMNVRVLDAQGEDAGCVADVPRWDFNWQLYYFYKQPIVLHGGQMIEVTCTYDTSADAEPIFPGWGTHNEMCLAGLYIVPPGKI